MRFHKRQRLVYKTLQFCPSVIGIEVKQGVETVGEAWGLEVHLADKTIQPLELKCREIQAIETCQHAQQIETRVNEHLVIEDGGIPGVPTLCRQPEREEL